MSGQRSADDAGDNLGNDGSEPNHNNNIHNTGTNNNDNHHHHHHHRPYGSSNGPNEARRRHDSTASGMAGGCSMREGADSIELRTGDASGSSSSNSGNNSSATNAMGLPSRYGSFHNASAHHHPAAATTSSNTHDGLAVFTWGRGEDGQLGLGDTADQDEPTYVSFVRSFCCWLVILLILGGKVRIDG